MDVNPSVLMQNRTKCRNCGKMQSLSEYYRSDAHGFFYNQETGKGAWSLNPGDVRVIFKKGAEK
jgi:hypothetical protein